MSRWVTFAVLCILCGVIAQCAGCSSRPKTCVERQHAEIKTAWRHYEWSRHTEVLYPDWRKQAWQWARIECNFGQPVRAFRP